MSGFLTVTGFLQRLLFCTLLISATYCTAYSQTSGAPYFASGIKVGEVDQTSAIVWCRTTQSEWADFQRLAILTEGLKLRENPKVSMPVDVVPGKSGRVRVVFQSEEGESRSTEWATTKAENDFVHQFRLTDLIPGTKYRYQVETQSIDEAGDVRRIDGRFVTAPTAEQQQPISFIVTTCQAIRSIDSGADGHVAYQQMLSLDPNFFVHTGDIVYYDKVPFSKSVAEARAKWNLMFSYGHNRRFHLNTASYFMKDDHDTLKNDCWPGQRYGDLTFDQGLNLFREQVCMGDTTYRTIRWGKDVQIWMTEHRDFRSSNRDPDGPAKTILGEEQKEWLMKTLRESDATHKFVITPGPIVGPDKKGKADNHSNAAFAYEGKQLRAFLAKQKNTYVICGDRHWQYCSRDPESGLLEMGCGPINDQHSFGGNPGEDDKLHRYFSPKGGFLLIQVQDSKATAKWMHSGKTDPETNQPEVLHTESLGD